MLCSLLAALLPIAAPLQEGEDPGFYLPGYLDFSDDLELVSPWTEGLRLTLEVERRSERLANGEWLTVGGARTRYTVATAGQTDTGQWLLDFTSADSRSLLAPEDQPGGVGNRIAALADGITLRMLCDDYGVPDTVTAPGEFLAAVQGRRADLVASLQGPAAAVAAELVPLGDEHLTAMVDLCDAWCVPIGYFLDEAEPIVYESYEDTSWSVVMGLREVTFRLEEHDELAATARVSCDDRPIGFDETVAPRLASAGLGSAAPLGPVITTNWVFDLESGLPTQVRRVELDRLGPAATRETLSLRVVGR